jgi:hypothetical protein
MQFEELDNKIKEAADHHHPAYDDNAWARMEKMLDQHLPQENDRKRRFIFFIFLFLLLGGGSVWLFSSKPWIGNKHVTTAKTTVQKPAGDISAPVSSTKENTTEGTNKLNTDGIAAVNDAGTDKIKTSPLPPDQIASLLKAGNKKDRQNFSSSTTGLNKNKPKTDELFPGITDNKNPADQNVQKNWPDKGQVEAITTKTTAATLIPDKENKKGAVVSDLTTTTVAKPAVNDPSVNGDSKKENTSLVQNSQGNKEKSKNNKKSTFFFTLSAGPDISATGNDKLGKTKLLAGVGLGYTYKDRLTIRSGFYTGRKIYTSSPASYHPPESFWTYYPNMEKVDADCRIYEIPLSLSYNFGHSSKQNWFVSAGISSYLMKKETYNYYYKYYPGGPTIQKDWTVQDENKHYFSVLTFSGGYQKNIGKSVTVMVEPYFKLPLSGVGFGKVKLNSGGVLFSVGIKPFNGTAHKK